MERLDELSLGVLGQTLGEDKEHPPVASSTTIDHTASSVDVLQMSFDVPRQTLVHLSLAVRWEQVKECQCHDLLKDYLELN